jgi:hypothetical protein
VRIKLRETKNVLEASKKKVIQIKNLRSQKMCLGDTKKIVYHRQKKKVSRRLKKKVPRRHKKKIYEKETLKFVSKKYYEILKNECVFQFKIDLS